MDTNNRYVKEKVEFYLAENIAFHLTLSTGKVTSEGAPLKKWANGKIESVDEISFVFNEEKLGKVIIFFGEVIEIEPRREKEYDFRYGLGEGVCAEEANFRRKSNEK
jgi:hypothetical protein